MLGAAFALLLAALAGCAQPELDGGARTNADAEDILTANDGAAGASAPTAADGAAGGSVLDAGGAAGSNDVGPLDGAAGGNALDAAAVGGDAAPSDGPDGAAGSGSSATPDGGVVSRLHSYEAESGQLFGQAAIVACAMCSNSARVSLKADSGFNLSGVDAGGAGTRMLVVYFTNGDSNRRTLYIDVNGSGSQAFFGVFGPTGAWDKVSSAAFSLSGFRAGTNNVVSFFIDTEQPPPDVDRVEFIPQPPSGDSFCDRAGWQATASVTVGDGSGPPGGIDGDLKTRWANNRPQDGTDWYQVDFGGAVKLDRITLDNSQTYPDDYPGSYAVYASLDGVTFDASPFVTGNGTSNTTVITFDVRTVRAIKITEVGSARSPHWWQIGEVEVDCSM
jgi:hypothetical protein